MSRSKTEVVKSPNVDLASWKSVDGQTYTIRFAQRGEPVKDALPLLLVAAFGELAKGGDPTVVLGSAAIELRDLEGRILWPPPRVARVDLFQVFGKLQPTQETEEVLKASSESPAQPAKPKPVLRPSA